MRSVNLAMAFLLELAVLVAVAHWGFTLPTGRVLRAIVTIGAPVLMAVLWGLFAAPRASIALHGAASAAFQIAWFGVGALTLAAAGRTTLAIALAAVYALNSAMLLLSPR